MCLNIIIFLALLVCLSLQPNKLTRSQLWLSFTFFYALLLSALFLYLGYSGEQNSRLFLVLYSTANVYCICMQYMFSPAPGAAGRAGMVPVGDGDGDGTGEEIVFAIEIGSK